MSNLGPVIYQRSDQCLGLVPDKARLELHDFRRNLGELYVLYLY
jgi:hypothetical protein